MQIFQAFHSHGIYLLDVCFGNPSPGAMKGNPNEWFCCFEEDGRIERLELLDKGSEEGVEFRDFRQASVSYDDEVCELSLESGKVYALDRIPPSEVPNGIASSLQAFAANASN